MTWFSELQLVRSEVLLSVVTNKPGGLVVIGLFLLRWNVSESIRRFEEVAQKTFGKRATFLARALRLLVAYVQDGQYSLAAIETAFQKTLNSPLQMFNPLRNDTKVAVTTTSVKDSTPWLFTNYNAGKRPLTSGMLSSRFSMHVSEYSRLRHCAR